MKGPVRWGVILGVTVAALSLVFGLAGWHRTYEMSFVFLAIAIPINVVTVLLCLHERASAENWSGQVKNGLVGSVIIFFASWLITTMVIPDYFVDMARGVT